MASYRNEVYLNSGEYRFCVSKYSSYTGDYSFNLGVATYTVTFNPNGGSVTPTSITKINDSEIGALPIPSRDGHTFVGWFTATTGGTQIMPTTKITANVTYYARWIVNSYAVTLDPSGGSVTPSSIVKTYDSEIGTLPTPTRTGYDFVGWFTQATGGAQITSTTKVTVETTYYARWTVSVYTVTLDPSGGDVTPVTVTKTHGMNIGTLPTPTREGHTFVGWFTAATDGTQITPTTQVTAAVTYYAHWVANIYTVTLDPSGGVVIPPDITKTYDSEIGTLPIPTRTGYDFIGWFTETTGGTQITSTTKVTVETTYFARWTISVYTVTLDPSGGSVESVTITKNHDAAIGELPTPSREGHTFVGWFTAVTGGTQITPETKVTAAATCFARWDANIYTVTLDPSGGSVMPVTVTKTYDSDMGTLPTPTCAGYTFVGWFTEPTGGTRIAPDTKMALDVTYYARWERAITQHEGDNRQETAAQASAKAYPDPAQVDTAILAYSYDFPDALTASYLAGVLNAPILLTDTSAVDNATATELARLRPATIYIVGGTGVISEDVEAALRAYDFAPSVIRLGGAGRTETAYLIACEARKLGGIPASAFVVHAGNFPDALSAGSLAAGQGVPILLTDTGTLDGWTQQFLTENGIADIIIVGGPGSVSEGVAGQLRGLPSNPAVARWSGSDRYATSKAVLDQAIIKWGVVPSILGLASGEGFPDALVGGAVIGNRGGLLAITDPDTLSAAAVTVLTIYKTDLEAVEIFGGTGTIRIKADVQVLFA
jgi:uncharacterized repeat protein (TIGR02543 family)